MQVVFGKGRDGEPSLPVLLSDGQSELARVVAGATKMNHKAWMPVGNLVGYRMSCPPSEDDGAATYAACMGCCCHIVRSDHPTIDRSTLCVNAYTGYQPVRRVLYPFGAVEFMEKLQAVSSVSPLGTAFPFQVASLVAGEPGASLSSLTKYIKSIQALSRSTSSLEISRGAWTITLRVRFRSRKQISPSGASA